MFWSATGAMTLALAVMLGAFGAHALKGRLDAYQLGIYEKAVFYQFVHGLGLLVVSVLPRAGALSRESAALVCALLLAGIVLFSGSLYVLAVTGTRAWGAITPVGGVAFVAGWGVLAYVLARGR